MSDVPLLAGWSSHRDAFTRGLFGGGSGLNAMTFARTVTSTSKVEATSPSLRRIGRSGPIRAEGGSPEHRERSTACRSA